MSERLRCSLFCGGPRCRYDTSDRWSREDMAIDGIFSHWITEDLVAMARPHHRSTVNSGLPTRLKRKGIGSVINLQTAGEHSACGAPLLGTGFSYDPSLLMTAGIYYFNFPTRDDGVRSVSFLLDMVKVVCFCLRQGKLAIHCHAGLGRTGVLVACYLIFRLRVGPFDAVRYIRSKRPKSVQTRGQMSRVVQFAEFVRPALNLFLTAGSLNEFLALQRRALHGYESTRLRLLPKLVFVSCQRLLTLCGRRDPRECVGAHFCAAHGRHDADWPPIHGPHLSVPRPEEEVTTHDDPCSRALGERSRTVKLLLLDWDEDGLYTADRVADSLLAWDGDTRREVQWRDDGAFLDRLALERDLGNLVHLLFSWLWLPRIPPLNGSDAEMLSNALCSVHGIRDPGSRALLTYLFGFADRLGLPAAKTTELLKRKFADAASQRRTTCQKL